VIALRPQSWQQVRNQWGWVRNGLQAIIERTNERWMPEDIWVALRGANAFLHNIDKDGDDVGFLVLQQHSDPDGPALFVWAMWCEPGALMSCKTEFFERLREVAQRIGAARIRMESPREGWEWVGYLDPVLTVYEAEL
jgi:hypothetical protein